MHCNNQRKFLNSNSDFCMGLERTSYLGVDQAEVPSTVF